MGRKQQRTRRVMNGQMYWVEDFYAKKAHATKKAKLYEKDCIRTKVTKEAGKWVGGVSLGSKKYPYVLWTGTKIPKCKPVS